MSKPDEFPTCYRQCTHQFELGNVRGGLRSQYVRGFMTRLQILTQFLVLPPSEVPSEQLKSDRQRNRLNKRKAVEDLLNNTRDELFSGEFDG